MVKAGDLVRDASGLIGTVQQVFTEDLPYVVSIEVQDSNISPIHIVYRAIEKVRKLSVLEMIEYKLTGRLS